MYEVVEAFPFLKSCGGKTQLLDQILPKLPNPVAGTYFEPFVGGGAVFFALRRAGRIDRAVIADTNPDLIAAYRAVQTEVEALIANLMKMKNTPEHFLNVRALDPTGWGDTRRGARFLYLNKTCFNGLWRTNQKGQFNVPFAGYKNPTICDADGLRAASRALQRTAIVCADFADVMKTAKLGDAIYCDPPYFPVSKTANFTSYGKLGFKPADQERLAAEAVRAAKCGARLVLSNADVPEARALYDASRSWHLTEVAARRAVNRDGTKRGPVGELIIECC